MTECNFDIKLLDIRWIKGGDDPNDLCAHGNVFVKINEEVICDKDSLEVTVSSTALYLMRTLESDYKKDDYASQLLPCCGHFYMTDDDNYFVAIMGCPSGIDWTISHIDDNKIKHVSEKGQEAIIKLDTYKEIVLEFVDKVEEFYKKSKPKITPKDDFDKKGYLTFWNEWRSLRDKWM
ncbi:MAG: hypothetical protein GY756_03920 [bacterium]|nr:hypothetical protein [bacterium]